MSDLSHDDDDDLDALLDKNLSEIDDLPSFVVPPKGTYIFLVSGGRKRINDIPYVTFDLEVVSTIKLQNDGDKPPAEGDKTGVMFNLDNEFGEGNMKAFLAPFAAHFGTDNVKELVKHHIQNVRISATLDHQVDKKDKTKIYARPKNIVIQ